MDEEHYVGSGVPVPLRERRRRGHPHVHLHQDPARTLRRDTQVALPAHRLVHPAGPEPGQEGGRQRGRVLHPGPVVAQLPAALQGHGPRPAGVRVPEVRAARDVENEKLCQGQYAFP